MAFKKFFDLLKKTFTDKNKINPFILNQDEILLNLFISTKDISGLIGPIALQLYEDVELADGAAQPLHGITLSMPLIETMYTGTPDETLTSPVVNIYPNPVVSDAIVSMVLPDHGNYNIQVYNVVGKLQETVSNEYKTPGKYMIRLGCSNYPAGIYLAKIMVRCGRKEYQFSQKIIVQR